MPVYEYECEDCGRRFEVLIKTDAGAPVACDACGSGRARRLFSTFAVASAARETCPPAESDVCGVDAPCRRYCPRGSG